MIFHTRCRLCKWNGPAQESFTIPSAPRSVNDLPAAGSIPGQHTHRLVLWECPDCGHMQLAEQNVPETWRAAVTAAGVSPEMRRERLGQFRALRGRCSNDAILEIGSGDGSFLPLLAEAGFLPEGLEWSDEMVEKGRAQKLHVRKGHVLDGGLEGGLVQNFVCINFLEHVTEPRTMMSLLHKSCCPDAVGLVEVPNFSKDLVLNRSHDLVAEHLSYFTERTLRICLELSGFEIIDCGSFWNDDDIYAIIAPRKRQDLEEWSKRDPAISLLWKHLHSGSGPQAIWGASHQALTLLSMLDSSDASRISCIADSSPRKQGRMEPKWGIPILSPTAMLATSPDQILIMAAGYSDEVASQLRFMGYDGTARILADGQLREVA